ncbi:HAUS augmin-like complex subunit 7 [Menidia menidia]
MAGPLTEKQLPRHVYELLQVLSCPMVQDLYLKETDSMLQVLCSPSELRTDILAWICSRISPSFEAMLPKLEDPDVLTKEMAALGHELTLCKADDLGLIKGDASPQRQLGFLEQLLTLVPHKRHTNEGELLLSELFAADSLPHLSQMLRPSLDPWPAQIKLLCKGTRTSPRPEEEADSLASLLESTQSELELLKSKCDFLGGEDRSPAPFSPGSLRLAAGDLQQLMKTFCRVFQSELRPFCSRPPPPLSPAAAIFHRLHGSLLACTTELEMLKELSETSSSVSLEAGQLQNEPRYWSRGEKQTLPNQLEEISKRMDTLLSQFHS